MLFTSLEFAVFFALVVALYCVLPARGRGSLLLLASYVFYGWWKVEYLFLLWASTALDYTVGVSLGRTRSKLGRRLLVSTSLLGQLGMLATFKYLGLFTQTLVDLGLGDRVISLVLPVGISFYTFQSLSYVIDVYRRHKEPERNPLDFALFVAFFPQLVAGPIERSTHLLPQLKDLRLPDYDEVVRGSRLIAWGLFKKLAIADPLAFYVELFYHDPLAATGSQVLVATYFFAFQIYCDFSGYSDIARGTARFFGVDLMLNFRRPYASASIGEFWRRWHISLSTWFRDYVYIPLGGSRVGRAREMANLVIVFAVSGLWHGAAWHFVIWGLIHGSLLVAERVLTPLTASVRWPLRGTRLARGVRTFCVFHLVVLAWVFFRAPSLGDALTLLSRLPTGLFTNPFAGMTGTAIAFPVIFLVIMDLVERYHFEHGIDGLLRRRSRPLRWCAYLGLVFATLLFGSFTQQHFIYFRF